MKLIVVKPKENISTRCMFMGYATFNKNQPYVAYKCSNIPSGEKHLFVLPEYESEAIWCVPRHFMIAKDALIIVEEDVDHEDIVTTHGIQDKSKEEDSEHDVSCFCHECLN